MTESLPDFPGKDPELLDNSDFFKTFSKFLNNVLISGLAVDTDYQTLFNYIRVSLHATDEDK